MWLGSTGVKRCGEALTSATTAAPVRNLSPSWVVRLSVATSFHTTSVGGTVSRLYMCKSMWLTDWLTYLPLDRHTVVWRQVGRALARDRDLPPHNQFTYFLDRRYNTFGLFDLDKDTGVISMTLMTLRSPGSSAHVRCWTVSVSRYTTSWSLLAQTTDLLLAPPRMYRSRSELTVCLTVCLSVCVSV